MLYSRADGGWNIRSFISDAGHKPVQEWFSSLDGSAQAAVVRALELLREFGTGLELPHVRHLDDGIWELRAKGQDGIYRILYFQVKARSLGLLHGFTKKTQRTPAKEIAVAKERRGRWLEREAQQQARESDQ